MVKRYSLTVAVLKPLLSGATIANWSPFHSTFFDGFAKYFKDQHHDFEEQIMQLSKLHKQYLLQLFELQNFRLYFPQLITLPSKLAKVQKKLLPLEFLEDAFKDYEKRSDAGRNGEIQKRYFLVSQSFFKLFTILRDPSRSLFTRAVETRSSKCYSIRDSAKSTNTNFTTQPRFIQTCRNVF